MSEKLISGYAAYASAEEFGAAGGSEAPGTFNTTDINQGSIPGSILLGC